MEVLACDNCKVLNTQRPLYQVSLLDDEQDPRTGQLNPNPKVIGVAFYAGETLTLRRQKVLCARCATENVTKTINQLIDEKEGGIKCQTYSNQKL